MSAKTPAEAAANERQIINDISNEYGRKYAGRDALPKLMERVEARLVVATRQRDIDCLRIPEDERQPYIDRLNAIIKEDMLALDRLASMIPT